MARRFVLDRERDPTGISGTGIVAEGVEFDDGTTVIRWITAYRSTAIYSDIIDMMAIHGHNGDTHMNWIDV